MDASDDIAKYFEANGGYDALVYIHSQKHLKNGCFCTTEISGAYRKVLDVFRGYIRQEQGTDMVATDSDTNNSLSNPPITEEKS